MLSTTTSVILAVFFLIISPFIWGLVLYVFSGVLFLVGFFCLRVSRVCAKSPDDVESGETAPALNTV
jgi:hypothetical protein